MLTKTQVNNSIMDWRVAEDKLREAVRAGKRAEQQLRNLVADIPADLKLSGPFPGDNPDWLAPLAKNWLSEGTVCFSAILESSAYEDLERVLNALLQLRALVGDTPDEYALGDRVRYDGEGEDPGIPGTVVAAVKVEDGGGLCYRVNWDDQGEDHADPEVDPGTPRLFAACELRPHHDNASEGVAAH